MENPQAFPVQLSDEGWHDGMTLRDYFAGQVLTSLNLETYSLEDIVCEAYTIADAMLKERSK